jgi:predicted permease
MRRFIARFLCLFRGRSAERELAREIDSHLALIQEDFESRGLSPEEAKLAAMRAYGGVEVAKELQRETRTFVWIEQFFRDLRYGGRNLLRNPGFAAVAVLSLALGIGANTAIFSLIEAILLRQLPVSEPAQLMLLRRAAPGNAPIASFSFPRYERLRDGQQAFSGLLAWSNPEFDVRVGQEVTRVSANYVSGNYYQVLGVQPWTGRMLIPDDDRPDAQAVAVVSYAFWQSRFGERPDVIGQIIYVQDIPVVVVGVMPPQFFGTEVGRRPDVTVPAALVAQTMPQVKVLTEDSFASWNLIGRCRPGVNPAQVRAALRVLWPQILTSLGDRNNREQIDVQSAAAGISGLRGRYASALWVLMALVSVVLLIACANVANLLLARATARQREFDIRVAVGAGRRRLVQQLLVESALLSLLGGAAGTCLSYLLSRSLVRFVGTTLDVGPNGGVLAFTGAVALLTTILFGLYPALRSSRVNLGEVMKGGMRTTGNRRRVGMDRLLVAGQVGLSLLLLVCAGLFAQTLYNLRTLDAGFDRDHVLILRVNWGRTRPDVTALTNVVREALERAVAAPGVRAVSFSNYTPLGGSSWTNPVQIEGEKVRPDREADCYFNRVTTDFFTAFGTPLLLGRSFRAQDTGTGGKVVIVNEAFVRTFFPDSNPLGRRILLSWLDAAPFEIVGVAKDARYGSLRGAAPRQVYLPFFQGTQGPSNLTIAVRTAANIELEHDGLLSIIRSDLGAIHRYATFTATTLDAQVDSSLSQERLMAMLSTAFGLLAMGLAMVGLYGALSYAVGRRTSEIGIRMALGAQRSAVLWLVLRETLVLVCAGAAAGIVAAVEMGHWVESLLFGVKAADPLTLGAAATLLIGVALLAAYVPARRASRIDPLRALRYE